MAVTLTEAATRKLLQTKRETPGLTPDAAVRLKIQGGGCAGFTYVVDFDNEKKAADNEFVFELDGETLTVRVDTKSYLMINGIEVDFVNSLMEQRFTFNNPNATGQCGCGTSFAV